ncbi:MAG: hypothetical protein JSR09_09585 [Bacteroidetes bacterium]|nr:hypothetical protein [Bacteroidota bacterium]MBS1640133.1 hypothetical protein [Bacteroidota bacterium]MBS1649941.1 hypothetical protein [Bacteroidota bacterium]
MKRIYFCIILLFSYFLKVSAQENHASLEAQLSLISNEAIPSAKAIGISIINNSNIDCYVSGMRYYTIYTGLHFYKKDSSGTWIELDILKHKDKIELRQKNYSSYKGDIGKIKTYHDDNFITKKYSLLTWQQEEFQDSILKKWLIKAHPTYDTSYIESTIISKPLFIKANKSLKNYLVVSLDYLFSKPGDYRITFKPIDETYKNRFSDTIIHHQNPRIIIPKKIFTYNQYVPVQIPSNELLITVLKEN